MQQPPLRFVFVTILVVAFRCETSAQAAEFIEHEVREIEGWRVHIDVQLLNDKEGPGADALRLLANKLFELKLILPADKIERLKQVPIWIDLDHPLKSMQYHPNAGWLRKHGYDPAMVQSVHIPRAQGLIDEIRKNRQPSVVLHELAHAYHDRELGFDDERIRQTFDQAVQAKLYDSVLIVDGHMTRHYALSDHKEYFAEMTEAFFGTNDFYPGGRGERKQHDRRTYELLADIWGVKP